MKNKVNIFVVIVLAGYFILGFSVPRIVGHEVFPFFRWDLFTFIPSEHQEIDRVIIKSVDGEELNPPVFFTKIRDDIVKSGRSIQRDYTYITNLANTIEGNDRYTLGEARNLFEKNFSVSSVEYDLVKVEVTSHELWESVFLKDRDLGDVDDWDFETIETFKFNN